MHTFIAPSAIALSTGAGSTLTSEKDIASIKQNDMQGKHPNELLIERFFEAYSKGDREAIKNILSADIQWHIPGSHKLSGTKRGIEEVLKFFEVLGQLGLKAESIVVGANNTYVIDCHHNWCPSKEGNVFEGKSCLLWRIENGNIMEVTNFPEDQASVDAFYTNILK